ncbi:MAG: hypothetical protein J6Q51_03450 [Clostridia bacterium]|nr:hypothetical protein [Clostridia bacterium]
MNNIMIYEELIEGASESSKLLILSQLAIDDGDLTLSQKYFLQVKDILNTLKNDTFEEIKELYNNEVLDSDDYDITSLNLAALLNDACKTASVLIGMEVEEQSQTLKAVMLEKLIKTLNACSELFDTLFN